MIGKLKTALAAAVFVVTAIPALAQFQDGCNGNDWNRRDWDQRIAACTELIETPGIDPDRLSHAYASRALAFSLKGRHDDAIRDYDRAIELIPDFAVALNNRAWAYFKSGRAEQGRDDVERSLLLDPSSGHSYDTRAHIRQWTGDLDGALLDYNAAIRFGGEQMIELYQCGLQYQKLYTGPTDGVWTPELQTALEKCVGRKGCDPLPPDEVCRPSIS
ncbi:MAG: tetratricopeptide repeat protein [Hyphomicrobiaceae bacterium]